MHIISPAPAARSPLDLESGTARRMIEAATTFLASLRQDQSAKVMFPTGDEERLNWHYTPRSRRGLSFEEMDGCQRKLAHALLSSGLSRRGYAKAMDIMALEAVLGSMEGPRGRFRRDPDLYCVTIFGTPSDRDPWGWRVEGHHLSVNFLVVSGKHLAPTPNFFGANPAHAPEGLLGGLRLLAAEEDLARRLLQSMDDRQKVEAVISVQAPADITTGTAATVDIGEPVGLSSGEMRDDQQRLLEDLLTEYTSRVAEDVAEARMNEIEKEGRAHIHFSWAGGEEIGRPHYYRVHGPSFLLEFDNTQDGANHIHTVWRDLKNDWGRDLLRDHYARSHRQAG